MGQDIKLNFINRSSDTNNSSIVIFQQNAAVTFDEKPVAWRMIKNCGRGDNHPFTFPLNLQVMARDSWGNYTAPANAVGGQAFGMVLDTSGDVLTLLNVSAGSPNEVEVHNQLARGAINACILKDGKLLAVKTGLAPGEKASFQFNARIYIGVVGELDEGDVIHSAIASQVNTEIDLIGITSADVVMTGGGAGQNSTPFEFHLENINQ
ncbi:hypothetical protein HGP17_25080 [Rhizobium sp. P38BS-XIX]|nr:hypothetical protein [Rhizobium sp. P38BS-XIX]